MSTSKEEIKAAVKTWKWRMIKACGEIGIFCEKTNRHQPQVSEWINEKKVPTELNYKAMEKDLKKLGV